MKDLNYQTPDSTGYVPDEHLIGQAFRHTGNGKTYVITDFAWLGATDEWGFVYTGSDGVRRCRPISHLTGNRANGEPRYESIK